MRSMSCGPGALSSVLIIVVLIVSGCNVNFGDWPADADGDGDADSDADGDLDADVDAEDINPCDDVSCGDHGECNIQDGEATCVCELHWYGDDCAGCYPGYHPEDGDCVLDQECLETSCAGFEGACGVVDYVVSCDCPEGYDDEAHCAECSDGYHREGESCVANVACEDMHEECSDHETCVEDEEAGTAWCVCSEGYGGEDCSLCLEGYHHEDDDCVPNVSCGDIVCVHGSCEEFADGSSRCVCHTGYVSDDCSDCADGYHEGFDDRCEPNETCDDFPCPEHATCTVLGGVASCVCDPGYEGEGCDMCSDGYHDHGDGECVPTYCGDGFLDEGEECDRGEANSFNGPCLPTCEEASCGDGHVCSEEGCEEVLEYGVEYCDDGPGGSCAYDCLDGERIIDTVAGGGVCDGLPARAVSLYLATGVAVDEDGDVLITDNRHCRVRRINTSTTITTTIAGSGECRFRGDGRLAVNAGLSRPHDVVTGSEGRVYIVDQRDHRVRQVDPLDFISTIVGTGSSFPLCRSDRNSLNISLTYPCGIGIDHSNNLIVANTFAHSVGLMSESGTWTHVAGTCSPGFSGDGSTATSAMLDSPDDAIGLEDGTIVISDHHNCAIRAVSSDGTISTIAGTGGLDDECISSGDGGPATSSVIAYPASITEGLEGWILIAEYGGHRARRFRIGGIIETIAGNGVRASTGDGSSAIRASVQGPWGIAQAPTGEVYVSEYTYAGRIRRFTIGGDIETIAGNGFFNYCGDVGTAEECCPEIEPPPRGWDYSATNAPLNGPAFVDQFIDGSLVWTETGNHVVRIRLPDDGTDETPDIDTLAGNGCNTEDESCNEWAPGSAEFDSPMGVDAYEHEGEQYILVADTGNDRLRRLHLLDDGTWEVDTVAEGLDTPVGVAVRVVGADVYFYVAERGASRVSVIEEDESRLTYIDDGDLGQPEGIAFDAEGALYVADSVLNIVHRAESTDNPLRVGDVFPFAGNSEISTYTGDGDDPLRAGLLRPTDVAVEVIELPDGGHETNAVFIVDSGHNVIRVVREETDEGFVIRTVAGTGACDIDGDRGPATSAALCEPTGLAVDGHGGLYIADTNNNRIRHAHFPGAR